MHRRLANTGSTEVNRTYNPRPAPSPQIPPPQNFAIAPDRTNRYGPSLADRNYASTDRLARCDSLDLSGRHLASTVSNVQFQYSLAYSALACFRMGMSESASFQRAKKS